MSPLMLGLLCGLAFGAVAVATMIPLPFPDKRAAMTAALLGRFGIGLVITVSDLGGAPAWLRGLIFGLLLSLPDAIVTKAYTPILGLGTLGGLLIGVVVGLVRGV